MQLFSTLVENFIDQGSFKNTLAQALFQTNFIKLSAVGPDILKFSPGNSYVWPGYGPLRYAYKALRIILSTHRICGCEGGP